MKDQIIEKLGKNHKTTIEFTLVNDYNSVYGLYTFKNNIYVLKAGEDLGFEELSISEQNTVLNDVISNNWKLNASLQ